jgi:DNA polymerase-3 subunit epsilon
MRESILKALQDCAEWAGNLLANPDAILIDTETTGLLQWDEVVSIAVMSPGGELLYEQSFRPERHFDPKASAITGLTADTQRDCPPWADHHDEICRQLAGMTVVCFNARYDRRLIYQTSDRYGLGRPPAFAWECAQDKAHSVLGGKRWVSLTKALGVWTGWPFAECQRSAHGAHGDCARMLELLRAMVAFRALNARELRALTYRIYDKGAW